MNKPLIIGNPADPWSLVDSPWGQIEAWRASTLATGTMGALTTVFDIVRNDAASAAEREATMQNTMSQIMRLCDAIDVLHKRVDAFAARKEALQLQHRLDAEKQRRLDEEPLVAPPGTTSGDPPTKEDDDPSFGHIPTGDLHSIPAKDHPSAAQHDQSALSEPEDPTGASIPQPVSPSLW
jgi:hypothetical protein